MIQQLFSQLCKTRKLTMRTMLHICCTFCLTVALVKNVLTMTLHKAWVEQHWCKSVAKPHWPFSYQRNLHKYSSIIKGIPTYVVADGHGFANGDFVLFTGENSMPDVDGIVFQVRDTTQVASINIGSYTAGHIVQQCSNVTLCVAKGTVKFNTINSNTVVISLDPGEILLDSTLTKIMLGRALV